MNGNGDSVLRLVIASKLEKLVVSLIQKGVDVNIVNGKNSTALITAADKGQDCPNGRSEK